MTPAALSTQADPHIPVLLRPILKAAAPISGVWLDGTFGAGGYSKGLLDAGANTVIGLDRDPAVHTMAAEWVADYGGRLRLVEDVFSNLDHHGQNLDGVVLDLGVSSMQLDQPDRGFSFLRDGPLDMRMSQHGPSAAELVNEMDEGDLADLLFRFGEERASRRIARAIVARRNTEQFDSTLDLASVIESCLPRAKPNQSHPATRSFQALRIGVNNEYGELFEGLIAAERALKKDGLLVVVTFHSVEDRMVKRFLQTRAGRKGRSNRFAPDTKIEEPQFDLISRKAIIADAGELAENPRARSAKLRIAKRTSAVPGGRLEARELGMPVLKGSR